VSSIKLLNYMKEVLKILYPGEDVNKILGDLKSILSKYENNETILAKRRNIMTRSCSTRMMQS